MGRGLAQRPPSCTEHWQRSAVDRCDDCLAPFCGECFIRDGPRLRCRTCWLTAPARAAEATRSRTPLYRLRRAAREHRASVVAGGIITGVLLLLVASAGAGILGVGTRDSAGDAVGRVVLARWLLDPDRQGPPPPASVPTPPPGPTPIPSLLSQVEVLAGAPGDGLLALTDRRAGADAPVWRSARGRVAADMHLITGGGAVLAGQVLFAHSATVASETWAKDVEVWASPSLDAGAATVIGRWTLAATTESQVFAFPRRQVRTVRLRVLSNHGSPEFTSLAEIALLPAAG